MADDDDGLAAELAAIRERNEDRIRVRAYTEHTVEHEVAEGDVRRLLAVADAVLKLADEMAESAERLAVVPPAIVLPERGLISRMAAARERDKLAGLLRSAVLAGLTGEGNDNGG